MKTLVWTDGSCNAEGVAGRGGWAALIERDGSTEQLVGSAMETRQNRMELTAVCEALERVNGAIEVRTDSKYIEKCSVRAGTSGGASTISGGRQKGP
jgi:ribonuclease HI